MSRPLPSSASLAEPLGGGKLHAPAASRNAEAIASVLQTHAPSRGTALEIASGTGQHVTYFAARLPGLQWQPTDIEPARLDSIDAHVAEAGLDNIAPARALDATSPGWSAQHGPKDVILLVNLLHLISADEVTAILTEATQALAPGGVLFLYGPFRRDGLLTSAGDRRFDAELRGADPAIGYKDTRDIARWLDAAGLAPEAPTDMPANNLIFIARKA